MQEPNDNIQIKTQSEKKKMIPRRTPSVVVTERKPVYITADKTTCLHCSCFPKEDPYIRNKQLNPCQKSPLSLYELASKIVNELSLPAPFNWSVEDVANWISDEVGLPQYRGANEQAIHLMVSSYRAPMNIGNVKGLANALPTFEECITKNRINGLRLLMLEDPSKLPELNIHNFHHILMITYNVRRNFNTDLTMFSRSLGLPPRKPLTHCTWFKSRTGPTWGIRRKWTRTDVLRWMKMIMPEPLHLDHWDLVWYQKPDFPKVMFARVGGKKSTCRIPHYQLQQDVCNERLVPRKFRLLPHLTESKQVIWMEIEKTPEQKEKEEREEREKKRLFKETPKPSNLMPKVVNLTGLRGFELKLARRKMPKRKILP